MYKRHKAYIMLFPPLILSILVPTYFLLGQSMDQTDPVKIANYALGLIRVGDVDGLLEIMHNDQKNAYLPFTPDKREQLQELIKKDQGKVDKFKEITELRLCTTPGGKPGVAARIWKKSGEVFMIILVKENNNYYYESTLTMTSKAYKELTPFKESP